MIKRSILIVVMAIAMAGIFGSEANAGCIDFGGGFLYCAEWIPGSEVCLLSTNNGVEDPVECKVAGTGTLGALTGRAFCAPNVVTVTQVSSNIQECNHVSRGGSQGQGHTKGKGKGHQNDCKLAAATVELSAPLTAQGTLDCEGSKCQASLSVEINTDEGQAICDEAFGAGETLFVSFVADEFFGEATLFVYGSEATETITERCTLHPSGKRYTCTPTETFPCVGEECGE